MSLHEFYMESCTSDVLKEWVELCGGPGKLTRKADRAEFLVRTLTSPSEVRRLWADDGCITLLPGAALTAAHHAQLAQIADAVEGGYQLSLPKLLALLETGPNLDLPRSFLEQRNRGPLPQAVLDLLSRAEEDSRALEIHSNALIIRVRSQEIADAVLNDPAAGKLVRRLDARTLLIPAGRETALRNALRALGYGLRGKRG
jgi:hypothetical protein